ncbi:MAG: WD40 repeat domain-containing protein, partial [Pirellulaceae bacterium]
WDIETLTEVKRIETTPKSLMSMALSSDTSSLAAIDPRGSVWQWDLNSGKERFVGTHGSEGKLVVFNDPGTRIVSMAQDGKVNVWEAVSDFDAFYEPPSPMASTTVLSPDGRWIASGYRDGCVRIWDAQSGEGASEIGETRGRDQPQIRSLAFNSDGSAFATAGQGIEIRIYSTDKMRHMRTALLQQNDQHPEHFRNSRIGKVQFSADNKSIFTTQGLYVRRFDFASLQEQLVFENKKFYPSSGIELIGTFGASDISRDGAFVACAVPGEVQIRDITSGEVVERIKLPQRYAAKGTVALSADSRWLCVSLDNNTWVASVASRELEETLKGHGASIFFGDATRMLLTGTIDGFVWLTDLETKEQSRLFSINRPIHSISVDQTGCISVVDGIGVPHVFAPTQLERLRQATWIQPVAGM